MRMMMQMMEMQQGGNPDTSGPKEQTLEINAAHPLIVNLNYLRKVDMKTAGMVSKQLLDNILIQSGVPFDQNQSVQRNYSILEKILDQDLSGLESKPQRKLKEPEAKEVKQESEDGQENEEESVLHKASRMKGSKNEKKIMHEFKVTEDLINKK